jgi:phage portal protein BeeE
VQPFDLDPSDVVHFRFGLDPDNPRKGFSPLKSVLKEVYTDDEAARFTASLLRNMGIPGLIVSPDTDTAITKDEADATKQYMKDKFGGDRRGEPMVMTGRTKVEQFGFSPDQMLLRDLRKVPEERVTAVLGIPASVAGLGAGLDRNTFTNYGEARSAAYEQGIIPMQKIMGEDVRFQLLTDFETDVHPLKFRFRPVESAGCYRRTSTRSRRPMILLCVAAGRWCPRRGGRKGSRSTRTATTCFCGS